MQLHVKKPGGWFWTPLSRDVLEKRIRAGLIQPDWKIRRDGESEVSTVDEFLKRAEQPSTGSQSFKPAIPANLEGIGGWLVLVGLGLALAPIQLGGALITSYLPLFTGQSWSVLTTPGTAAYHWMWKPWLLLELFGTLFLLIWVVALLFLFFGRKRIFPSLMIAFYAANLLLVLFDLVAVSAIPVIGAQIETGSVLQLVKSILLCVIWIPYFLISVRVKKTFTQ